MPKPPRKRALRLIQFHCFLAVVCFALSASAQHAAVSSVRSRPAALPCREAVLDADLEAGKPFETPFGGGLKVYAQPVASGWIIRILPVAGPAGEHDYAELATPPYRSPSPLSLSTDFVFRAQDAIAWNPRRFRFATSPQSFAILLAAYQPLVEAGPVPPAHVQAELAHQIAQASEGTLTILDARLIAGTADQSRLAAPVAQHFEQTPHTFVSAAAGTATPLGSLLAIRVRITLELPLGFSTAGAGTQVKMVPHACSSPSL